MSKPGESDKRVWRPVEEIPVLTEVVDATKAGGLSPAQVDALVAQIERGVLEELAPRLEDAVHQAVRNAVERALAPAPGKDKTP
ncbi:MAG: hypothetical protein EPN19_00295 [Betaproteobacteria bacterium]|nr:MAG: hypothetical protein EPN19_00295 [Betaproteobacteria bacterium]